MEMVNIYGMMAENMKENINSIKNMGSDCIFGQMEGSIRDSGLMENNMDLGNISYQIKMLNTEFGKMESELVGWIINNFHRLVKK